MRAGNGGGRRKRHGNGSAIKRRTHPTTKRFEGMTEDIKDIIYDASEGRQSDQFFRMNALGLGVTMDNLWIIKVINILFVVFYFLRCLEKSSMTVLRSLNSTTRRLVPSSRISTLRFSASNCSKSLRDFIMLDRRSLDSSFLSLVA